MRCNNAAKAFTRGGGGSKERRLRLPALRCNARDTGFAWSSSMRAFHSVVVGVKVGKDLSEAVSCPTFIVISSLRVSNYSIFRNEIPHWGPIGPPYVYHTGPDPSSRMRTLRSGRFAE